MKILVAITEVVEVADDFAIEGSTIDARYREFDLNEWDEYAVEAAVQLQEAGIAEDVVSVTIGPERSEETIRVALAKGVDRAIRVWDEPLDQQDLIDVAAKTRILKAVVEEEAPDLVLTGVQAADDAWSATGVSLAHALGFEWAAVVSEIELEGDIVHLRRELEGGVEELVDVELPAILTIQTGINQPRYASLRGIRQAQSKEIETMNLDDIGQSSADVQSAVELIKMFVPETEGETRLLEGEAQEQASALADILDEKDVVAQ